MSCSLSLIISSDNIAVAVIFCIKLAKGKIKACSLMVSDVWSPPLVLSRNEVGAFFNTKSVTDASLPPHEARGHATFDELNDRPEHQCMSRAAENTGFSKLNYGCRIFDRWCSFAVFLQWVRLCRYDMNRLVLFFSAAHVGFQPQQSDQEEQRAGEPDGQADPDVSTCGGKASAAFIIITSSSISPLYSL